MRGKETYYFNEHATKDFLHNSRMKRFIRAHEARRGAFESLFNGRLLHIFSTGPFYGEIQSICVLQETEEETIYSLGLGIRFDIPEKISLSFDWGRRLGQEASDGDRSRFYISTKIFF